MKCKLPLTENQKQVIAGLELQGAPMVAAATKRHWEEGQPYYLDKRVAVRGIRRKFTQGNKEAVQAGQRG